MATLLTSHRHLIAVVGLLLAGASLDLSLAYFQPVAFVFMVLAIGAMAAAVLSGPAPPLPRRDTRYLLVLGLFGSLYGAAPMLATLPQQIVLLVPLIVVAGAKIPPARRYWFWAALGVLLVSHAAHIVETSGLRSDVNILFKTALTSLLHGQTVYRPVPVPGSAPIPLVYPPGALLLLAPSLLMTGDNRWGLLSGELVACAVIWTLLPRRDGRVDPWREALVLIPLALPRVGEYFFEAANHDWVVLAVLAVALVALTRGREVLAALALGLAFATKQTVLVYPGVFLLRFIKPRMTVLAIGVAIASVIPFLLQDFHGTLTGLLDPSTHGSGDYPNRLHLYAALVALGLHPGRAVQITLQGAGLAAGLLFWLRSSDSPARALAAAGAAWILLVMLSPFAGYNYYAYGIALFAWGMALQAAPQSAGRVRPSGDSPAGPGRPGARRGTSSAPGDPTPPI